MDRDLASELRLFIDHLAAQGVTMLSVRQGDERLHITLNTGATPEQTQAVVEPIIITAAGPGVFHTHHPDGAKLACIEAGDFLFPVTPINDGDEILAQQGEVVGYGTPLIRRRVTIGVDSND